MQGEGCRALRPPVRGQSLLRSRPTGPPEPRGGYHPGVSFLSDCSGGGVLDVSLGPAAVAGLSVVCWAVCPQTGPLTGFPLPLGWPRAQPAHGLRPRLARGLWRAAPPSDALGSSLEHLMADGLGCRSVPAAAPPALPGPTLWSQTPATSGQACDLSALGHTDPRSLPFPPPSRPASPEAKPQPRLRAPGSLYFWTRSDLCVERAVLSCEAHLGGDCRQGFREQGSCPGALQHLG